MDTSSNLNEKELIYDWNTVDYTPPEGIDKVEFDDETLRDGLQSASITDPTTEQKLQLLHLMEDLGIPSADIGLPGAGPQMREDVLALAKEIVDCKMSIVPNCAARTVIADAEPIVEVAQKTGVQIEASLFIGSSPIRGYVENWTVDQMLKLTEESVTYAKKEGLLVMYVTEDTTRAHPETIRRMYQTAIDCGADRVCIADTVGHATPHGTTQLVSFIKDIIDKSGKPVTIDWHGHNDRGLSVINSMAAVAAGALRIHGCGLGIGERSGNAPMEQLLINYKLLGVLDNDLTKLEEYCKLVSEITDYPIPPFQPVVGSDAFRTATGVHASAILKAQKKGHNWLADRIYSSVPAEWVGRKQTIDIGHMSGAANVIFWLEARGYEVTEPLVQAILQLAKSRKKPLSPEDIEGVIRSHAQ